MTDHTLLDQLGTDRTSAAEVLAGLEAGFSEMVAASQDVATDDEHDPEGHTIAFERQQLAALVQAAQTRLAELDGAIERCEAGRYGICETCGQAVAPERLEALPETRFCIRCAESSSSMT